MYTFLDIIKVDRTFHYETHFVKKKYYNNKLQTFDYKINILLLYTFGMGGGGSGKAYLLYTFENVDNCEQPLNTITKTIPLTTLVQTSQSH